MPDQLAIYTAQTEISKISEKSQIFSPDSNNTVCFSSSNVCERQSNGLKTLQIFSQPTITCSKLTVETLEKGVKYVQS